MKKSLIVLAALGLATLLICGQTQTVPVPGVHAPQHHAQLPFVFAYIDPGTASLVFQSLVAGLLGMLFAIKRIRDGLVNFLRMLFRRKPVGTEQATPDVDKSANAAPSSCTACSSCQASRDGDKVPST